MHQKCVCQSPLQCTCAGSRRVTYVLGGMDLLSLEEDNTDLTYSCNEWEKISSHVPAGTDGMKPLEVGNK